MVSKITSFDYLNARKKDYQEFAKEFYQIMAKKEHLDLVVNFCDDDEMEVGNTSSICTFDLNYQPTYIHYLTFNISQIFEDNSNYQKRFFEFINCLFHELYHVKVMEMANKESCFNLTSLFSVVEYIKDDSNLFWDINYNIVDEEIKAYLYGLKKSATFIKKYYPDAYDKDFVKNESAKLITSKLFYNHYFYNGERLSKSKTLNKLINSFKYEEDRPYPLIINKIYKAKKHELKSIDELVLDYTYYYYKYPYKIDEIKNFYANLITEKFLNNESFNVCSELISLLKLGLRNKKQILYNLKQIHPIKVHNAYLQSQFIKEQQIDINNLKTSIKGLF